MFKFFKSFCYAYKGIVYTFNTQLNFKIHISAALIAIVLGWIFNLALNEWLWLILSIAIVLILELLNTALEEVVDLISPNFNEKAGRIKDVAAAAVLVAAIMAIVIGLLIFVPKIFK